MSLNLLWKLLSLSLISKERLEEASNVISIFPLLYPLIAVLGWDLLSGKIESRQNLMKIFCKSKSDMLKSENFSLHETQNHPYHWWIICARFCVFALMWPNMWRFKMVKIHLKIQILQTLLLRI